ncbi:MAG: alpha/beta hydrolase [Pseudomonadales bacterium]
MMDFDALRRQLSVLDCTDALAGASDIEKEYFRYYGIDFEAQIPGVTHQLGVITSAEFDVVCHVYRHEAARGTVYIVHGYFDHAGLYGHIAEYFLAREFNVVLLDLPGHGLSSGPRATIEAFADYELALQTCVRECSRELIQPALFVGQSTGAAIIMQFLLDEKYSGLLDVPAKVLLLAPLVRPAHWPVLRLAFRLNRLIRSDIPRGFSNNSHDETFLEFLRKHDPLQFNALPMQWVQAMSIWIERFKASPVSSISPLVLQGPQDKTVDWRFNLKAIRDKFPTASIQMLTQGKHHLANESPEIREKIFAHFDAYLDNDKSDSENESFHGEPGAQI